jgi:hypothetical protein
MKGQLELQKFQRDGKVLIRVIVRGNVGADGRVILDTLGMTPVVDIANCREKYVSTPVDLDTLRDALVTHGIVERPKM